MLLRLAAGGQTLINADALRGRDDVKDADLPQRLQQLDAELAVMGKQLSLPGKLDYLRQVLRQPQQYFKAGLESTWLDRMGVVTPPDLGGAQLDFGLIKLGEAEDSVRERVVFPGSITRRDLLQWRERWPQ
ncbi:hypothetical protein D3C86_1829390 [compost metagenome]